MESSDLVFELTGRMMGTDEYGASIQAILEGKAAPPAAAPGSMAGSKARSTVLS